MGYIKFQNLSVDKSVQTYRYNSVQCTLWIILITVFYDMFILYFYENRMNIITNACIYKYHFFSINFMNNNLNFKHLTVFFVIIFLYKTRYNMNSVFSSNIKGWKLMYITEVDYSKLIPNVYLTLGWSDFDRTYFVFKTIWFTYTNCVYNVRVYPSAKFFF